MAVTNIKTRPLKASALRLLDAAERLFAEYGIDGVSLIEIARAAGQANRYATQYHFGTKENLISAIFEIRLARISERRQQLIDQLIESGAVTINRVIDLFIRPVYEEVGADGLHYFARFAARAYDSAVAYDIWGKSKGVETGNQAVELLRQLTPHLSPVQFDMRSNLLVEQLLGALALIDTMAIRRRAGGSAAWLAIEPEEVLLQSIRSSERLFD